MPTDLLYSTDAYLRTFSSDVAEVDPDGHRVALHRTAFYPGGGGQPHDVGELRWDGGLAKVERVKKDGPWVWHYLAEGAGLPDPKTEVQGTLDWERRHLLMRTHTAMHMLGGVMWQEFKVAVTGGNMTPGEGRMDFELDAMSAELGKRIERRINEEITRAREILVEFVDRAAVDVDEALVRTKANLIPPEVNPLRVIDIRGLDRQADGGTHVASTLEVGRVRVVKTESKGKGNKRIRLAVEPAEG